LLNLTIEDFFKENSESQEPSADLA